jgi:predicted CopG family antitoxin
MKTRATFVLDEELLIELKTMAIKERKSYSEALEELIKMKADGKIKCKVKKK